MRRHDPLANPKPLIRRVYAYVAYRIGDGPEAEDVTNDVFERALRYRGSYDPSRGEPITWLLGIARRCADDALARPRLVSPDEAADQPSAEDLEGEAMRRLDVTDGLATLDERSRELLALRYGADLRAREIGEVVGMRTNAVEVALHRALNQLRAKLEPTAEPQPPDLGESAERAAG
jgi:RNA polymerase sigma factor (sigma-70 family)